MGIKGLFCEHPNSPLKSGGEYCSYYSEIFYALNDVLDIKFVSASPSKISELGNDFDFVILGFGHTNCSGLSPKSIIKDIDIPVFPILNKEYAGLQHKLNWIKDIKATAALTVHHNYNKYSKETGVPFHRIMWSCNKDLFKDYGENYEYDLFYSGVIRKEQYNNFRSKIYNSLNKLKDYRLLINARHQKNNFQGKIFSAQEYAKNISKSKICFTTTSPADIVNPRYFECMSSHRCLILCNKIDNSAYSDMFTDGYNCVMFDNEKDFFDKCIYYIKHEDERMSIVNSAYNDFIKRHTWQTKALEIKNILGKYL